MKKVLIMEDELNIRSFVVINLKRAGYETVEFGLGEEAANYLRDNSDVSIAVLDVMLPDISGFDVCRKIRETGSSTPILMLTAREEEADKVMGLELGADDSIDALEEKYRLGDSSASVDAELAAMKAKLGL